MVHLLALTVKYAIRYKILCCCNPCLLRDWTVRESLTCGSGWPLPFRLSVCGPAWETVALLPWAVLPVRRVPFLLVCMPSFLMVSGSSVVPLTRPLRPSASARAPCSHAQFHDLLIALGPIHRIPLLCLAAAGHLRRDANFLRRSTPAARSWASLPLTRLLCSLRRRGGAM